MHECRVEIAVTKGRKSMGLPPRGKAVSVNGVALPNVASVDVAYHAHDVRKVTIVLIPTDVVEVNAEEPDGPAR